MKPTNKIKITFHDGSFHWIQATNEKIIAERNVIRYVFHRYSNIKKIESRVVGVYDKNYRFFQLHYDDLFETWKNNSTRIEAINPEGHEDYTGYGNRCDGKRNRFYIGKSTGWMPIYLEVLNSNSSGGASLYLANGKRQFNRVR